MIDTHKLKERIKPGKTKICKEFERYDKNTIRMSRQYTNFHVLTVDISCISGIFHMNLLPIYYF